MGNRIFVIIFFLGHLSCEQNKPYPRINFYYWKTTYSNTKFLDDYLNQLKTKRIYMRLFDIVKSENNILPNEIIQFKEPFKNGIECIPTIFIRNEVWYEIDSIKVLELADKCSSLSKQIMKTNGVNFKEMQIDCDWSIGTRGFYFYFLEQLKKRNPNLVYSVTIRLHQIKYFETTGVPPVHRFVLMMYNIGSLGNMTRNSIYNHSTASMYIPFIMNYPKKLSIALPIFSWAVHMRDNKVQKLLPTFDFSLAGDNLEIKTSNLAIARSSFFYNGRYFKKGDKLKHEGIEEDDLKTIAVQLKKIKMNTPEEIIYFHLDSTCLKSFSPNFLREIGDDLSN